MRTVMGLVLLLAGCAAEPLPMDEEQVPMQAAAGETPEVESAIPICLSSMVPTCTGNPCDACAGGVAATCTQNTGAPCLWNCRLCH